MRQLDILYEDDQYLLVHKPPSIVMVPNQKGDTNDLVSLINQQYGSSKGKLHPCHRLDKDTTGVAIFAKGKANQQAMRDLFHNYKITKNYIAFIHGHLDDLEGVIKRPIRDKYERKFRQNTQAKAAKTKYEVLQEHDRFSIVLLEPLTGRTNQIRIHFANIEHPIVGEDKYAFKRDFQLKFKRTALHASRICFKHPFTGKVIDVESPLPKDMVNFLNKNT